MSTSDWPSYCMCVWLTHMNRTRDWGWVSSPRIWFARGQKRHFSGHADRLIDNFLQNFKTKNQRLGLDIVQIKSLHHSHHQDQKSWVQSWPSNQLLARNSRQWDALHRVWLAGRAAKLQYVADFDSNISVSLFWWFWEITTVVACFRARSTTP